MFAIYNNGSVGIRSSADNLYQIKNTDAPSSVALKPDDDTLFQELNKKEENKGFFIENESGINDFQWSDDQQFLVSADGDNAIRLYNFKNNKLLATCYTLGNKNWAIVTPDGLFDASANGMNWLHYAHFNEALPLDQLKERYYEPDLLQKLLGYNEEPLRNPAAFGSVELFPKTKWTLSDNFIANLELFETKLCQKDLFMAQMADLLKCVIFTILLVVSFITLAALFNFF